MAEVKYIPAEIDGSNVFSRKERKLAASDVRRGEFDGTETTSVEETLVDHENRIVSLEGALETPEIDRILVSGITWDTLVNFEGNLLVTGVQ